ncbi:MAG: nickel-dependent hydrogenase large subunit [Acetobacteraceae bacterium]
MASLAHWIVIDDGQITNYQAVVPTTWNAGPMDDRGQHGPYEAALDGQAPSCASRPAAWSWSVRCTASTLHGLRSACVRACRRGSGAGENR